MVDITELLGINAGDSTEIRDIAAPGLGDEYLDSYYGILTAAEKNTIHFAETQAGLPTPTGDYDALVGVAQTERASSQRTLHFYDGEDWVDTFDSEIISAIEDDIAAIEDDMGSVAGGSLQTQIDSLDEDIGNWSPSSDQHETITATLGYVEDTEDDLVTQVGANDTAIGNMSQVAAGHSSLVSARTAVQQ